MRRAIATAAIVASSLVVSVVPAWGAIRITVVQYDSPGSDTGGNGSLNAEWVRIKNTGSRRKKLEGWTLRDTAGHVYRFRDFRLRAGRTVTVHTGSGSDGSAHVYQDSGAYIWNNDGDTAKLKRRNGNLVDRCHWDGGESPNPPKYC